MKTRGVKLALFAALISFASASSAFADTGNIGAAIKGGTLGLGGEVSVGITSGLNVRAGYNAFDVSVNATESDIKYDCKLHLKSLPVLLDWHPSSHSPFRLSSGIVFNNNDIKASGTSQSTYTIGEHDYTGAEIGTLTGGVDFNSSAPYAGIGWGDAVGKDSGITIAFDLGVMFQGRPDITLTASNPSLESNAAFQTDLAIEQKDLQDKIKDIQYYPVLSLALGYRF